MGTHHTKITLSNCLRYLAQISQPSVADSALYAQLTGQDVTGKASLPDVDKQVANLISVF